MYLQVAPQNIPVVRPLSRACIFGLPVASQRCGRGLVDKKELVEAGVLSLRANEDVQRAEWGNLGETALPLTGAVVDRPVLGSQRTSVLCDSAASTLSSYTPLSFC